MANFFFGVRYYLSSGYRVNKKKRDLTMRTCKQCGLPQMLVANKELLEINEDGICIFCQDYNVNKDMYTINYLQKQIDFEKLIEGVKGKGKYDAVVMFTGGKDSTYSIYLLTQKYKLKVLAVTWDNGFFGTEHRANLENVTKLLGVDHEIVSLDQDVLSEFYRNRFKNFGRFCGCGSAAYLFTSKTIAESEASLIFNSASLGQTCSRLQSLSILSNRGDQKSEFKVLMDQLGFFPFSSEQITLMIILDIVVGEFSEKSVKYYYECIEAMNSIQKRNATIVNLACIFEWNLKNIHKSISSIGWKKPSDASEMGHTSCRMELMKGYVASAQNILNLDVNELSTELRFGNITRAEFEEAFKTLGYSKILPEEFDSWAETLNITKAEFNSIIERSLLSRKELPLLNYHMIDKLPIQIPSEKLKEKLSKFYSTAILG